MIGRLKRRVDVLIAAACLLSMMGVADAKARMVAGPSFEVAVSLSPAAAARLASARETVVVDAEFYGVPSSERERMADQGRLDLSPEQKIEIPGAGVAHFTGPTYDGSKLRSVEGGTLDVAVEVYSGRHSSPDNLLDCDTFENSLQLAASRPVPIRCRLIGETP